MKFDPFDGHVKDPGFFVSMYAFLIFVCLAMAGFLMFTTYAQYQNGFVTRSVSFFSMEENIDGLLLFTEDDTSYLIPHDNISACNTDALSSAVGESSSFLITIRDTGTETETRLYGISDDAGTEFLSVRDTTELTVFALFKEALLFWIMAFLCTGFSAAAIVVGRHPDRYRKKVVNLFFKDDYINHI